MKTVATYPGFTRASTLICIVLLALGGCTALQPPPARAVYDFGSGAPSGHAERAPSGAVVLLDSVQARGALEGTAMHYRLAYADAQQLQPYAQARWSMAPAQLLHQRVGALLGAERTVLQDSQGLTLPAGSLHLYLELDEFSQVFAAASDSVGLVRVQATLARREGGAEHYLAQRSFTQQRPAPTPDARGGARALREATDALAAELARWLSEQEARPSR